MNAFGGLLSLQIFVPLVGAVILLCIPKERESVIKWLAAAFSLATLLISCYLYGVFDPTISGMQLQEKVNWIPQIGASYHLGLDGLSLPLVLLTSLLTFLSIVYSFIIKVRVKEYFVLFLLLETGTLGVFLALDMILFYVFWEVSLVPMYFLIGIWGHERREYAAIKFFLYTLAGSVLMLLGILIIYFHTDPRTFDLLDWARLHPMAANVPLAGIVFWFMFIGFAIKVPVWPFHTWLPDAHVEAPTAGSVILAGVLLKMGTYAFMRIALPVLPHMAVTYAPIVAGLALISIIYGSLVAMAQSDLKKLVAYSSVAHMGFVMLGIAAGTPAALHGAILQMFSHGLLTGALFFLVGILYERAHHRVINNFGGLGAIVPIYSGIFIFIALGSLGLPGMSGFVSELFVLMGAFPVYHVITGFAVLGIVLGAAYLLWTVQRVLLGEPNERYLKMPDMTGHEIAVLVPLMVLTVAVGLMPALITGPANTFVVHLAGTLHQMGSMIGM